MPPFAEANPKKIVLITGDTDFIPLVEVLTRRKYDVVLLHGTSTGFELVNSVRKSYYWQDFVEKDGLELAMSLDGVREKNLQQLRQKEVRLRLTGSLADSSLGKSCTKEGNEAPKGIFGSIPFSQLPSEDQFN